MPRLRPKAASSIPRQVVSWTLMSVVVAVLIDSFTTATEREKEKERSIT